MFVCAAINLLYRAATLPPRADSRVEGSNVRYHINIDHVFIAQDELNPFQMVFVVLSC